LKKFIFESLSFVLGLVIWRNETSVNVSVLKLELHDIPIYLFDKSSLLYIYIYITALLIVRDQTMNSSTCVNSSSELWKQKSKFLYHSEYMVCYICRLWPKCIHVLYQLMFLIESFFAWKWSFTTIFFFSPSFTSICL
jgi:hypothetical protein